MFKKIQSSSTTGLISTKNNHYAVQYSKNILRDCNILYIVGSIISIYFKLSIYQWKRNENIKSRLRASYNYTIAMVLEFNYLVYNGSFFKELLYLKLFYDHLKSVVAF